MTIYLLIVEFQINIRMDVDELKCNDCQLAFTSKYSKNRHARNCKEVRPRHGEFKCDLCRFQSNRVTSLYRHSWEVHGSKHLRFEKFDFLVFVYSITNFVCRKMSP